MREIQAGDRVEWIDLGVTYGGIVIYTVSEVEMAWVLCDTTDDPDDQWALDFYELTIVDTLRTTIAEITDDYADTMLRFAGSLNAGVEA